MYCRCVTCQNVVDKTKPTYSCLVCGLKVHYEKACSGPGKVGDKNGYTHTHTQNVYSVIIHFSFVVAGTSVMAVWKSRRKLNSSTYTFICCI